MFKRLLVSSAVLAVTSTAALASGGYYAPPVAPAPEYFNGFYVGIDVSRDVGAFSANHGAALNTFVDIVDLVDGDEVIANNIFATNSQANIGVQGINGEIFVGYSKTWNNFYLGGEIFGFVSSAKGTSDVVGFDNLLIAAIDGDTGVTVAEDSNAAIVSNLQVKMPYGFGISLMPGVKLNDSAVLYGRVGYQWTQVEVSHNGEIFLDDDLGVLPLTLEGASAFASVDNSHNKGRSGFQLGVGTEVALNANWSIRGEYDHVWFNSFDTSNARRVNELSFEAASEVATLDVDTVLAAGNTVKPQSDQFKLGVIYRFPA